MKLKIDPIRVLFFVKNTTVKNVTNPLRLLWVFIRTPNV